MSEHPEHPIDPRPERHKEFEDPHFHDEDELAPQDDLDRPDHRPHRRKPSRKLPNRRHYEG